MILASREFSSCEIKVDSPAHSVLRRLLHTDKVPSRKVTPVSTSPLQWLSAHPSQPRHTWNEITFINMTGGSSIVWLVLLAVLCH